MYFFVCVCLCVCVCMFVCLSYPPFQLFTSNSLKILHLFMSYAIYINIYIYIWYIHYNYYYKYTISPCYDLYTLCEKSPLSVNPSHLDKNMFFTHHLLQKDIVILTIALAILFCFLTFFSCTIVEWFYLVFC